jgi:lactate permease
VLLLLLLLLLLSGPSPGVTVANLGALMLVGLIRNGKGDSPAYYIGYFLSQWLQGGFLAISAFLGALGSFFSGSTTVSNLTFGDIQMVSQRGSGLYLLCQQGTSLTGEDHSNMCLLM